MAEHRDLIERRMRAVEPHAPDVLDVHRRLERRQRTQRLRAGTLAIVIVVITIAALTKGLPLGSTPLDDTDAVPPTVVDSRLVDISTGTELPIPDAFARFNAAKGFQLSPDGSMVAFYSLGRIYVSAPDGSDPRRISGGPAIAFRPTWSGDSSRLVYTGGGRGGRLAIHVHDLRTDESWPALDDVGSWHLPLPSLSPDGSTIMFTALIDGTFGLYTVPATGGEPKLLLHDAAYGSYAPEGDRIVYLEARASSNWGPVYILTGPVVADGDGGRPVEIGSHVRGWPGVDGVRWEFFRPMWSPDGTRIAYMPPSLDAFSSGVLIEVGDVETGATTQTALNGYWPTWFDDDTLAIQSRR